MILLVQPLDVLDGALVPLIELIPPVHQRVYRMGLEHLGVVVGEGVDEFSRVHRRALTGQQFQNSDNEPYYVLFEDFTHVKFHRRSLREVVELQGARFDGFHHVEDWVPQRIVTATGPDPQPRSPNPRGVPALGPVRPRACPVAASDDPGPRSLRSRSDIRCTERLLGRLSSPDRRSRWDRKRFGQ
jgi:hypothetical protein